ncbi:hypothetical protein FI667_g17173, partial [Globisporangium splendens]
MSRVEGPRVWIHDRISRNQTPLLHKNPGRHFRQRATQQQQHLGSDSLSSVEDPSWFSRFFERADASVPSLRRVNLSDQELCFRATRTSAKIDFETLTNLRVNRWTRKATYSAFTVFTMNSPSREDQQAQVLVAGDDCSLEEAISVLSPTNERELNATMKGLYRKEFIYGSIVHVVSPTESMPEETTHARQGKFSGGLVVVKTGTFVHSQLFSRNEEWCFVEANERSSCGDAFRLTQSTIGAAEIGVGRVAAHSRVDQLRDVTTAFLVEKQPNNRSVQLFFHGKFDCRNGSNENTRRKNSGVVSPKASKARLLALANGVNRIPNIIRWRRVGIQTLAATSVFAKRTNLHCTCCTERLHLLKRKKPCYLCGYYVCNKCW